MILLNFLFSLKISLEIKSSKKGEKIFYFHWKLNKTRLFILMPCHMCAEQRGKVMFDTLAVRFNRSFPTRKMVSHFVRDSNYFMWCSLISDFRVSGVN